LTPDNLNDLLYFAVDQKLVEWVDRYLAIGVTDVDSALVVSINSDKAILERLLAECRQRGSIDGARLTETFCRAVHSNLFSVADELLTFGVIDITTCLDYAVKVNNVDAVIYLLNIKVERRVLDINPALRRATARATARNYLELIKLMTGK
jgi:hypothetical protein